MLSSERTTRNDVVPTPGQVEGLVVASGRPSARHLVEFLKSEGINVQVAGSADLAFEEVLLHRPNLVIIEAHVTASGGVDLCARLKANARTHFVPIVLWTEDKSNEAFHLSAVTAGADAVFSAATSVDERRARLWALLRTQVLYRREEKKRVVQGTAIQERRRWVGGLIHDLQNSIGAVQANFEFLAQELVSAGRVSCKSEVEECVQDCRSLFRDMARGLRTVLDYERFESDRVALREEQVFLADLAERAKAVIESSTGTHNKTIAVEGAANVQPVQGDPDYLQEAFANLIDHVLRQPGNRQCRIQISCAGGLTHARVGGDHDRIPMDQRTRIFEPYSQASKHVPIGHGLGLALAKLIVDVHGGTIWIEDIPRGGSAFVIELPSSGPSSRLRTTG
jgi:Signal transduction histidine kinase